MRAPPPVPVRRSICLVCRVLLPGGAACEVASHPVAALDTPDGRAAMHGELWSTPRPLVPSLRRIGALAIALGCAAVVAIVASPATVTLAVAIALIGVVPTSAVGIGLLLRSLRRRRLPRGVPEYLRLPAPLRPLRGRVGGAPRTRAPLTGTRCIGYALELRSSRFHGGDVLLADGATDGFDVILDDGRIARVPAGPMHLEGGEQHRVADRAILDHYLREIHPRLTSGGDAPVPCDHATEHCLQPGDRVELFMLPSAPLYRDSFGSVPCTGTPRLRIL